jgi:NAD(P)-dependent dehydrogenase (short-subunit alcohol dehydrogenase family)
VLILGRNQAKLSKIADEYLDRNPRIKIVAADVSTSEGAEAAADKIRSEVGSLDHVVASSGPWWNVGSLQTLEPATWRSAMQANVDAHFYSFRYFSSLVNKGGSYVIMNGAAADFLPDSGLTGICAFSLRGLCKVLLSEGSAMGLRIYELLLRARVADEPPNPGIKSEIFGEVFVAIASNKIEQSGGSTIEVNNEADIRSLANLIR